MNTGCSFASFRVLLIYKAHGDAQGRGMDEHPRSLHSSTGVFRVIKVDVAVRKLKDQLLYRISQ